MKSELCRRCQSINIKIINIESGEEVSDNCGLAYEAK